MKFRTAIFTSTMALATALGVGASQAQEFSGAFLGFYGISLGGGISTGAGLRGGYNFRDDRLVFGVEADYFRNQTGRYEAFVNLRGGYAVTDQFLGFVTVGRGQGVGGRGLKSVGIGAEYMLANGLSLRLDYERHNVVGAPVMSGPYFIKFGANWNF